MNFNQYWLYFEPFTFCFKNKSKVLVYNSLSGDNFTYCVDDKTESILNKLLLPSNMYSTLLSADTIKDRSVREFIKNVQQIMAGDILPVTQATEKPIVIFPKINIYNDIKRFDVLTRHNIIENLRQITIYLDYTQSANSNTQVTMEIIKKILDKISHFKWIEIVIDCGHNIKQNIDIFNYVSTNFSNQNFILTIKIEAEYFCTINPFGLAKCSFNIIVHPRFNENTLMKTMVYSQKIKDCLFAFHISNEDDYERAESFCNKAKINSQFILCFNDSNLPFFERQVYLNEEDILSEPLSRKDIFRNQTFNTTDFGKLSIMPGGEVYANPYHLKLGTIDDDIRTLIYKELSEGQSWFRIRDMEPCCNCVYQWLCPSPSNYELAIGKPNLCHVNA